MKGLKLRKRLTALLVAIFRVVTLTRKNTFREFVIQHTVKSMMIIAFRPFLKLFRHTPWRLTTDKVEAKYDAVAGGDEPHSKYHSGEEHQIYCHSDGIIRQMRAVEMENKKRNEYCQILSQFEFQSILEVGAGEMFTMLPVMEFFGKAKRYYGMDLSLNRLYQGREKIRKRAGSSSIELCKADAAALPYPDNCFDVVFSSHCLEQIPYHYQKVINEMVRVSRIAVVLFEPTYELENLAQKIYMIAADYVRGIPRYVKSLKDIKSRDPFLLNHGAFLNRAACHILLKDQTALANPFKYVCPICKADLQNKDYYLWCEKCARIYFRFDGMPILEAKYSFYLGTRSAAVMRLARTDDIRRVWEIRNHPQMRAVSMNAQPIPFESHELWFDQQYFQNPNNFCFVLEVYGLVAGYCRFDLQKLQHYRLSIALDPAFQGQGLGKKLLEEGLKRLPPNSRVAAEVEKGNGASLGFLQKFGFRIVKSDAQYDYLDLPMNRHATTGQQRADSRAPIT